MRRKLFLNANVIIFNLVYNYNINQCVLFEFGIRIHCICATPERWAARLPALKVCCPP
jgi:hypothetical protein